jgi:hypothetical protein
MKKYFLNNIEQYSRYPRHWVKKQIGVTEPATRTLYVYDGYTYNLNEFGNLLFGAIHARRGTNLSAISFLGNIYSLITNGHFDEKNEAIAIERGYNYGKK